MEEVEKAGKDSSRVEWREGHYQIMLQEGSVVVEDVTEMEGVLEVEAATQGVLVEVTKLTPSGMVVVHIMTEKNRVTVVVTMIRGTGLCL